MPIVSKVKPYRFYSENHSYYSKSFQQRKHVITKVNGEQVYLNIGGKIMPYFQEQQNTQTKLWVLLSVTNVIICRKPPSCFRSIRIKYTKHLRESLKQRKGENPKSIMVNQNL